MSKLDNAQAAAAVIAERAPNIKPRLAMVTGSGLDALAEQITDSVTIAYSDLPGFPEASVDGHAGQLVLGNLKGLPVACLQGRSHTYEGTSGETFKTFIRTMKLIGCETILMTNSSGSLREEAQPGSLVLINDHINLQFRNPLIGPNDADYGPRFIGVEDIYDPALRQQLQTCAKDLDITLHEGVYTSVLGPNFETPAEIRAFRTLGADVIGMSTIPEVLVAHHCGLRIALVSAITNLAAGLHHEGLSHDVTLKGAKLAMEKLTRLVLAFVESYDKEN